MTGTLQGKDEAHQFLGGVGDGDIVMLAFSPLFCQISGENGRRTLWRYRAHSEGNGSRVSPCVHTVSYTHLDVYKRQPYLIVDDLMLSALTLAAKSGVDVRILTPENWDKRLSLIHI